MHLPKWLIAFFTILFIAQLALIILIMQGRNPLPFPDHGSRIFTAASPEAKQAIVELMEQYGVHERFQANSGGVLRSIFYDGTIINRSPEAIVAKLGNSHACIGLVADEPLASARSAAEFLKQRGFSANVVEEIEPGLPIAFVLTDALPGTAINFRPHVTKMPRPE